MSKRDEFVGRFYDEMPFPEVRDCYYAKDIFPSGDIFARLEALDRVFDERLARIHSYNAMQNELYSRFEGSENGKNFAIGFLKRFPLSYEKSELINRLNSAGYFERIGADKLKDEVAVFVEKEIGLARQEQIEFESQYLQELEFVYRHKKIDKMFAYGRLTRHGKFRVGEPYLMLTSGVISAEEIFGENIYGVTSEDRILLARATNPVTGDYLVPTEILRKKMDYLSSSADRSRKTLQTAIRISEESNRKFDSAPLRKKIADLYYETQSLNRILEERAA